MQIAIQKRAEAAILVWEEVNFKAKSLIRDKDHYIITKGPIHQEALPILNIYAFNIRAPKYIMQNKIYRPKWKLKYNNMMEYSQI